ncbi:hypothetical protein D4764_17G0003570, partial [Takifugu flavidus]
LTWQDDVTQQAISRELAKLRNTPLHRQAVPPGPRAAFGSSTDRKLRPSQAELHGNLQQYLNSLGLFSHPDVGGQSGVQRQEASVQLRFVSETTSANVATTNVTSVSQNDDFKSDPPFESGWSKPKPGWKETTLYSLHRGDGNPPLTKVITKTGEGRHPLLSSKDPGRNELPSKQLERLLAPGAKEAWPTGKLRYLNYIHPVGHSASQLDFGSSPQRPNPDKVLFQTSPNRHASKEPLGISDDRFIQNVVNQLGPHSIHMDSLMGNNLEQLAQVIAEVMQEEQPNVETQPAPAVPARGKEGGGNQDQDLKSNRVQDLIQEDSERMKQKGQQTDSVDKDPVDKHKVFFSKLLDYLNMEPFDNPPKALKMVGMENVHSQTKQGQVPILQEKVDAPQIGGPDGQVDSEIQRWMQGKPEEPKKSDLKVKTQLVHIGVKEFSSRGKGRHFGYIITGSESLTAAQASELMERLTQRLNLHAADLTQLSYVQSNPATCRLHVMGDGEGLVWLLAGSKIRPNYLQTHTDASRIQNAALPLLSQYAVSKRVPRRRQATPGWRREESESTARDRGSCQQELLVNVLMSRRAPRERTGEETLKKSAEAERNVAEHEEGTLSVLGPALTFRLGPNPKNLTTADLVQVA